MIDEYNKTHGVLTESSLQEREQGIGKRNDGTGMEEEMKRKTFSPSNEERAENVSRSS